MGSKDGAHPDLSCRGEVCLTYTNCRCALRDMICLLIPVDISTRLEGLVETLVMNISVTL